MRLTSIASPDTGAGYFRPEDHGLINWSFDPALAVNSSTPLATAGTVYVNKLWVPRSVSVTNIVTFLTTGGSVLTAGQCFVALYQGGTLKGVSADQAAAWATNGLKTAAIVGGPVALDQGAAYVAMWFNGTTGPAPLRGNSASAVNLNLAATASRFGTADTGRTTTAPSPLGTISAAVNAYWVALS
jgi:hypothetical protein